MTRFLYDLTLAEDGRASPFCWRAKYALAHKGLEFEDRPVAFTEIPTLLGGGYKTRAIRSSPGWSASAISTAGSAGATR